MKKEKIAFYWTSTAFTGHFAQQSSPCSLSPAGKTHYINVVYCVLTVGPLPDCYKWISWAHCPCCKAGLLKVKRPDLITHTHRIWTPDFLVRHDMQWIFFYCLKPSAQYWSSAKFNSCSVCLSTPTSHIFLLSLEQMFYLFIYNRSPFTIAFVQRTSLQLHI